MSKGRDLALGLKGGKQSSILEGQVEKSVRLSLCVLDIVPLKCFQYLNK